MRHYEIINDQGLAGLSLVNRDLPQPVADQVLIRVRASSVNYRDLMTILDPAPRGIIYPRIPNSDGAGEVVAIGDEVTRFKIGDKVCGTFFQTWIDGSITANDMANALGGTVDGMLAEYRILNQNGLVPMPDGLSFEEASTLPCAALTAWNSIFETGKLTKDSIILLLGTGGVSIMALQLSKMVGARVIITSSSDAKLERAKQLGAWGLVNYSENPDWESDVLELTSGNGVDHTVEVGGAGTLEKSIAATKVGGSIGLIGVLTGGQINPTAVMRKSIKLQGIYVGNRKMFDDMNQAIVDHSMRPVIDKVVDFEDAKDAFSEMRNANHFGKIVIKI